MTDIIELVNEAKKYDAHICLDFPEEAAKLISQLSQLLQQGEAVAVTPDFFQLDNGSDYWYECPDDAAIIADLETVTVGTEYTVFASHTYRQTYRVTKIPDEADDDTLVELVRSQRKYFTTPPDTQQKLDKAREALQEIMQKHDAYIEVTNDYNVSKISYQLAEIAQQALKDIS